MSVSRRRYRRLRPSVWTLFVWALLASAATIGWAQTLPIQFRLRNRTAHVVRAVFVSASSNSDWGASILGNLPLAPGSSTTLTFSGDCSTHDLRIVVDGSAEFSDDDLQFCFSDNSILSITMTGRALRKAKVARP